MTRIIAVTNQKGGVGKTTTAINLASYLTSLGNFVLLVDLDPQANATGGLGYNYRDLEKGIYEALAGKHGLGEIIINTNQDGFRLAPATIDLAGARVELVNHEQREFKLSQILAEAKGVYDYIIIDCPPSLCLLTVNGIVASDEVLIPVQAEYYSLEGLGQLLETVNLIKDNIKSELKILGAVLTMYDERYKLSQDIFLELYKHFPGRILRTVVPRNIRLSEAPSFGKTIFEHDPKSKGAKAYERLAREVMDLGINN